MYKKKHSLWRWIFLLTMSVAVTAAFAASGLYPFIVHSDSEISLYGNFISASQNTDRTGTVWNTTSKLPGKQAEIFDFRVFDAKRVWTGNTSIELFQTVSRNKKDKITVQSRDSGNIVAPGTSGNHMFSLKNPGRVNSHYKIWFEADSNISHYEIPIEFRISRSKDWIDGKGKWLNAEELNKVTEQRNLYSGKSVEYTLYWRWRFERDKDEQDTFYGNFATGQGNTSAGEGNARQEISYRVMIHTLASGGLSENDDTNSAGAVTKNRNIVSKTAVKTGDSTNIGTWVFVLIAAGAAATAILYRNSCFFMILRRFLFGFLGLTAGIWFCFTNIQKNSGDQLPMPAGIGMANVRSGSMEPTFSRGTLLIIRRTQDAARGDIVVYQAENSLVVHRVRDIQKDQIITQGDANNAPDPAFDRSEIKGVVIGWIPYLGTILNLFHTSAGYLMQTSEGDSAGVAKFNVTETGTLMQELPDIAIAPGDSVEYEIAVTNKSETAIRYSVRAESRYQNLPLEFKLYKKMIKTYSDGESAGIEKSEILSDTIPAGDSEVRNYIFEISWPTGGIDAEQDEHYAGKSDVFDIILKAEQAD